MTAQASDTVLYRDSDCKMAHWTGEGLLNVRSALGYRPHAISTACYAGYIAHYAIDGGRLYLTGLHVTVPDEALAPGFSGELPKLFGQSPMHHDRGEASYGKIREPMPFTGGTILGSRFIWDLYMHSGSHPAWKYERVFEVLLDSGQVTAEHDLTDQIAQHRRLREEMTSAHFSRRPLADYSELSDRIDEALAGLFEQNYGLHRKRAPPI